LHSRRTAPNNCLNEVLNGLAPSIEVKRLLGHRIVLQDLLRRWNQSPNLDLIESSRRLLADVIHVVMDELGDDEF